MDGDTVAGYGHYFSEAYQANVVAGGYRVLRFLLRINVAFFRAHLASEGSRVRELVLGHDRSELDAA